MAGKKKKKSRSAVSGTRVSVAPPHQAPQPGAKALSGWALPPAEVVAKIASGEMSVVRWSYKDLAPFEVQVPEAWKGVTRPGNKFLHECFKWSLDFVLKLCFALPSDDPTQKGIHLVHGLVSGRMPHGWVELPGGVVFDGVVQKFYATADYYRITGARVLYRYESDAVHYLFPILPWDDGGQLTGQWHVPLGLPSLPSEPQTVTRQEVKGLAARAGWKPSALLRKARPELAARYDDPAPTAA